jgi:hypothetical protein
VSLLDEVAERIAGMDPEARSALAAQVAPLKAKMRFVPLPGPQTEAYLSEADILLYGGQAGGGKSYLLMGLASQEHQSAIVFRRESSQTDGLEKAGKAIIADTARFNGTDKEWNWPDGRSLKLAGLQLADDWMKHAGRERDLIGYDEAAEFQRQQVSSMLAWLRGPAGQRRRMVLASNPPRSSDGYWVKEWFAPWLDIQYPNPAADGELRWAIIIDGSPLWMEGPGEYERDGETYTALSFTFIRAKLEDNPYRDTPEYRANLQALEGPLRAQLLRGDFEAGQEDGAWQAIPTEWVKLAQERWTEARPHGVPMCALGVDVAQGGPDQTVIAKRYDGWFARLEAIPGIETPSGAEVAGRVIARRLDGAKVIIDLGGGWGGDALKHLAANQVDVVGYMGVKDSSRRTRDNLIKFFNVRTESYWQFREALDPSQPGGSPIALPPDRELLADLTAPTYEPVNAKGGLAYKLISKEKLVKDLGRSPDKGDAVVMCWWAGAKAVTDAQQWRQDQAGALNGRKPKVIMGRPGQRR